MGNTALVYVWLSHAGLPSPFCGESAATLRWQDGVTPTPAKV